MADDSNPIEAARHEKLRRLAAYDVLEKRAYSAGEAAEVIRSHDSYYQPNWDWADINSPIVESAYKKSLRKRITALRRKRVIDDSAADELVSLELDLENFLEDTELAKEEKEVARWELQTWQEKPGPNGDGWNEWIKRPTLKQLELAAAALDQSKPAWTELGSDPGETDTTILMGMLFDMFPKLRRSRSPW